MTEPDPKEPKFYRPANLDHLKPRPTMMDRAFQILFIIDLLFILAIFLILHFVK